MAAFLEAFFTIDKDNNEEITKDELRHYMYENNLEEGFAKKWLTLFDTNNDGKITLGEFCTALGLIPKEAREMREQFTQKQLAMMRSLPSDVEIIRVDMKIDLQLEIVRLAREGLRRFGEERDVTRFMKKSLEVNYGRLWQMKSIQIGRLYFQSYRGFVRHFSRFPPITTTAAASRSILSKDLHPPVEVQNKSNRLSTSSMLATPSVLGCLPADLVIVGEPASSSSSDPSVVEVGESSQNYASCELVKAATLPNKVECAIYQCSQSAAQKFSDLFPDRDLSKMDVCVITLTHKTLNDMSVWNMHVEEEREQLMQSFVEAATNVCKQLQQAGYWADFIDPYSSTPHFGAHTNSTLEETDPRNCLFGVHIEDLGCCRVIRHLTWGTHAFVGTIFTNVPADHSFII